MAGSKALSWVWMAATALAVSLMLNRPGGPAALGAGRADAAQVPPTASQDGISVYFSPGGGITAALVREISNAKTSVYVQAAQFTSGPIARALVEARQRGLDVRVILDKRKDDDDHAQTDRLVVAGVPTYADAKHHTAHNKITIIDHRLITTGSFNFTRESESENAENLVMIFDKPRLVDAYEANFQQHLAHSQPFAK